jgi:hypothetical protein
MSVSAFGVGTPITHPAQFSPWALSPYGLQGLSTNPYTLLQQPYGQTVANVPASSMIAASPYSVQPLQQLFQLLQIVPQQLQQLQQLEYVQQQQLQQLQQLLQLIPGQLAQLQQLLQSVPPQLQQLQPSPLQQPFGQVPGLSGFAATAPWGISPQVFGAQPGHVM